MRSPWFIMTLQQLELMFASRLTCLKQLISAMISRLAEKHALTNREQPAARLHGIGPRCLSDSKFLRAKRVQARLASIFPGKRANFGYHTPFSFCRGWRWWAAKIQAPRGANYHIAEICLTFHEDNVGHETHRRARTRADCRTHKQAGWRRHKCASSYSSKEKRVQARVRACKTVQTWCILTYSHTSGWLSAQVPRQRARKDWNVSHSPRTTRSPQTAQAAFPLTHTDTHTQRRSPLHINHAFIEPGTVSDIHLDGLKGGKLVRGEEMLNCCSHDLLARSRVSSTCSAREQEASPL